MVQRKNKKEVLVQNYLNEDLVAPFHVIYLFFLHRKTFYIFNCFQSLSYQGVTKSKKENFIQTPLLVKRYYREAPQVSDIKLTPLFPNLFTVTIHLFKLWPHYPRFYGKVFLLLVFQLVLLLSYWILLNIISYYLLFKNIMTQI